MIINRLLAAPLRALFTKYPVVTVTGPRQAGKTTLCRQAFPELAYVNLESADNRELAVSDPRGFLAEYPSGVIIDEIQRAPDLVSYLQGHVDESGSSGQFVLIGSQQFEVSQTIRQSLAGRTGILRLLPFSIEEAVQLRPDLSVQDMLYTGFYPRIYDQQIDPTQALGDYVETYIERDVRQLREVRNLSGLRTFVSLCAGRVGQLLNLRGLGDDAGVSHTTSKEWISLLEASYVVFRLPPFHANLSKRLVKSSKLFFYDVGLAAHLLGIENRGQLRTHPLRGALFENLVVMEALKHRYNRGRRNNLHFYRDSSGHEVDLLYSLADQVTAIEAKSGATINRDYFTALQKLGSVLGDRVRNQMVVYGGDRSQTRHGIRVTDPRGLVGELALLDD